MSARPDADAIVDEVKDEADTWLAADLPTGQRLTAEQNRGYEVGVFYGFIATTLVLARRGWLPEEWAGPS